MLFTVFMTDKAHFYIESEKPGMYYELDGNYDDEDVLYFDFQLKYKCNHTVTMGAIKENIVLTLKYDVSAHSEVNRFVHNINVMAVTPVEDLRGIGVDAATGDVYIVFANKYLSYAGNLKELSTFHFYTIFEAIHKLAVKEEIDFDSVQLTNIVYNEPSVGGPMSENVSELVNVLLRTHCNEPEEKTASRVDDYKELVRTVGAKYGMTEDELSDSAPDAICNEYDLTEKWQRAIIALNSLGALSIEPSNLTCMANVIS